MQMRLRIWLLICVIIPQLGFAYEMKPIKTGLDQPWGIDILPNGDYLVTERSGRLIRIQPNGEAFEIGGVPNVKKGGQGGLLDIAVAQDHDASAEIFLSYASPSLWGGGTALIRARLEDGAQELTEIETLFDTSYRSRENIHYGGRILQARDGTLFLTIGDRGARDEAQNRKTEAGSLLRIERDGQIPQDNPFFDSAFLASIWSYGHRNPQGIALDGEGNIWVTEHGAKGGDELNQIKKGANYGWPVISYGTHYSGASIGEGTTKEGMEQPSYYWDPSMAPSGLVFYDGELFEGWKGHALAGALKFMRIYRLDTSQTPAKLLEEIDMSAHGRVRDLVVDSDGSLLVLIAGRSYSSAKDGALIRLSP